MAKKHPFHIGGVYRNRRGEYEVLGVRGDRLEVRFLDHGERADLDLATQARIWSNLQLEERTEQEKERAAVEKAGRGLGEEFRGMRPQDFSGDVTGTTWRSRAGLAGGLIARLQRHFGRPFTSTAVYKWPVVFLGHRPYNDWADAVQGSRVAKYTVQADSEGLHFGFYVERSDPECHDWEHLVGRLPGMQAEIEALEPAGIRMEGRRGYTSEPCYYGDGPSKGAEPLWTAEATVPERLRALASPLAEGEWRELYVVRSLAPDEAIQRGMGLVDELGDVFVHLAPFYRAAALDR